jgi:Protein of unknown function (DUF4233)
MTDSQRPFRPPRRLADKLGSVVLGFEALIVFLGGLVIYGLKALPGGIPDWWGIVAGVVVAVAMVATARFVQKPAGAFVGWMLQLIVLASALLVPAMALVVLIFGGMWVYARVQGPRIEARMAASEGE